MNKHKRIVMRFVDSKRFVYTFKALYIKNVD